MERDRPIVFDVDTERSNRIPAACSVCTRKLLVAPRRIDLSGAMAGSGAKGSAKFSECGRLRALGSSSLEWKH
jgi:hypothetical protein